MPGLFEFYDFYRIFLPLFFGHREFFYDWCDIGSIYGAPSSCIWGGGRVGFGQDGIEGKVANLMEEYGISSRLTFSNSLVEKIHLDDRKCNRLCEIFSRGRNGIIIHSDLLLEYLRSRFPEFYFVSSTTKVLTEFDDLRRELLRHEFSYVVPDFRLNRNFDRFKTLSQDQKDKVEFLCNECCWVGCSSRRQCYENVSRKSLGQKCGDWICTSPGSSEGYVFSRAMKSPAFISADDMKNIYLPMGFTNFKIEGRSLGSALLLEFILHYMTKPEHHLQVREKIYLDNTLDLF